VLLSYYP